MFGIAQELEYQFLCSLNYTVKIWEREMSDWHREMGSGEQAAGMYIAMGHQK